ncbi:MAG: hypothetical protein M3Y77_00350 [Actinomycetota bacterium]|nr:hypothetical protein [Actinomycetota bacterium]
MDKAGTSESLAQNVVSTTMPTSAASSIPASTPPSMARLRSLVTATVAALKQLPANAHQVASSELATVVGELDELALSVPPVW